LKPVEGKSYEVGVKSSWLDDKLTGTLSCFKTDEENYPKSPLDATIFNINLQPVI
jgi:outer membrane receptor for ferric coprogen and ferric-rhodotorulic acid